jgi:uncharacterized membrane protein YdfJ with MMPL/SSD domain
MTLVAASFLAVSFWILGILAAGLFMWFFLVPAVPTLYTRYKAWLQKKASGQ